ncbi:MAG: Hpt domain-containing protein, partial [Spirochaetia bacterium]|nr:Hpt domain-containing protein [Spirochaetia bacterium]
MKLCFPLEDLDTYAAFAAESQDAIEVIEQRVLRLEGVNAHEEIAPIFRCLHTLKGNSSFTKLNDFTRLSHQLENLFDLLRQQKIEITEELIQLFLQNFDILGQMIQDLRNALPRVETVGKFHVLLLTDIEVEEALKNLNEFVEAQIGAKLPSPPSPESEDPMDVESAETQVSDEASKDPSAPAHPQEITLSELETVFQNRPEVLTEKESPEEKMSSAAKAPADTSVAVSDAPADSSVETFVLTDEMKKSFHREAGESLAEMEQLALGLQKNPEDKFALLDLFRVLHSLKGNCGFFGLGEMETLSHRMESALGEFTREGVQIGPNLVPVALQGIDALRLATADWAGGGSGRVANLDSLLAEMDKLIRMAGKEVPLGEILVSEGKVQPEEVEEALNLQKRKLGEILLDTGKIQEKDLSEALQKQKTMSPPGSGKTGLEGLSEASAPVREGAKDLRVDLTKIDHLLDLVGELVIASSMVVNNEDLKDKILERFEKASYHLNNIVHELQNVTLSIRMIPVEATFRKMSRLVHDLSVKSGKKVSLELQGEKTEIDKNIIELIVDPLVHMIRNSMDHGLELPEERVAAGKNANGKISLRAYQEGGEICIALQDDGRGLNRERILAKARERGLLKADEEPKDDQGIYCLIFEPGFSTAEKITSTSGRGV